MRDPDPPPDEAFDVTRRTFIAGFAVIPAVPLLPAPLAAAPEAVAATPLDPRFLNRFLPSTRALYAAVSEIAPDEARALWPHLDAFWAAWDSFNADPTNGPLRGDARPQGPLWLTTFIHDQNAFRIQRACAALEEAHEAPFRAALLAAYEKATGAAYVFPKEPTTPDEIIAALEAANGRGD